MTSLLRSEQSPPTVPHSFPSDKAALKCENRRESGSRRRRRVSVPPPPPLNKELSCRKKGPREATRKIWSCPTLPSHLEKRKIPLTDVAPSSRQEKEGLSLGLKSTKF